MDSGNESSGSSAGHHAGGNPISLLESRKGRGTHKQILFGSVRFWSVLCRNDSGGVGRGTTDSIYRGMCRIQRRGRSIVNGKGNHISRLRGYRTLVPDDGDVAIRFSHTLCGGSFGIPFD